ncbi:YPL071C [Saccharomyces arboricola H-6]|uniref:YPL071C n=1 Tax=Saccharomyces arboricola (strain H-6 / AS 2.3317 / CBS 10644) TaxID=1160507 RepID=J8Q143_SACAR|nr:YPL071C [Saccharomyces arboricola H-6]
MSSRFVRSNVNSNHIRKRNHSPDPIGIDNYKRKRLIIDLENLSLNEEGPKNLDPDDSNLIQNNIAYSDVIHDKALKDIIKQSTGKNYDGGSVYDKIWERLREDRLQVIKWADYKEVAYLNWWRWFHGQFASECTYEDETDTDAEMLAVDTDIDMDA